MVAIISVPGVARALAPNGKVRPVSAAIEKLTAAPVEACSSASSPALGLGFHPFVAAVHLAFCEHRPLTLSPDMLWLLVAQGLGRIVNEDPEGMRRHFVSHEGKVELEVRRDHFIRGAPDNDWPGVFEEFSAQICEHIGPENHGSIVVPFSTTGRTERAANEVVLMSAMRSYFRLTVTTLCGIPEIRLEGTAEDWRRVADCTTRLGARYDCGWWTDHLVPWLDRVARCAAGAQDPGLWKSIYKLSEESGGPFANGWITQLFPYMKFYDDTMKPNWLLGRPEKEPGLGVGITSEQWPGSLSVAPFTWNYYKVKLPMEFLAGFTHVTQDETTLALRPGIGWAVRPAAS